MLSLAVGVLSKVGVARRVLVALFVQAMRASPIAALYVLARNWPLLARMLPGFSARKAIWFCLSAWAATEAAFMLYIMECRWRLNSQTNRRWKAVTVHSTEEKRLRSFERYWRSLEQVCGVDRSGAGGEKKTVAQSVLDRRLGSSTGGGASATVADGEQRGAGLATSRSADIGSWSVRKVASFSSHSSLFGSFNVQRQDASLHNLLELMENKDKVGEDDVRRLKCVELAAFFTGPGRGDAEDISSWMRQENLEDWISHYWFRGELPERLPKAEKRECGKLVGLVCQDLGLGQLAGGRNHQVRCYRTFTDPLPVMHRPLALYACTSVLCPLMTMQVMRLLGFHRERVGGLSYWKRDRRKDIPGESEVNGGYPMVFMHGLGVGLVPYYLFIARLSRRHAGDLFVPELPFLAIAPFESVPSAREVVAQLQDMLAANGHTAAHFAGHSFGALVIGWVLKMSPSSVLFTTLMEPAQFLLMKSECLCKVLYDPPATCYEMLIRYFAFRELFTVNLLCRNFFWEQSTMWPEDICVPALVELAGKDHIVQSLFVKRLVDHERANRKQRKKQRRAPNALVQSGSALDVRSDSLAKGPRTERDEALEVTCFDGFLHGEILLRPRAQDKLFAKMRQVRALSERQ